MREIQATCGKTILVDDRDFAFANQFSWSGRGRYPIAKVDGKVIELHRLLDPTLPGFELDHRNRDPFDNRRQNYRVATHQHNSQNRNKTTKPTTSRFKGVNWRIAPHNCWRASIGHNGRTHFLGHFDSEESAAKAYDTAAKKMFGPFAALNFPDQTEGA